MSGWVNCILPRYVPTVPANMPQAPCLSRACLWLKNTSFIEPAPSPTVTSVIVPVRCRIAAAGHAGDLGQDRDAVADLQVVEVGPSRRAGRSGAGSGGAGRGRCAGRAARPCRSPVFGPSTRARAGSRWVTAMTSLDPDLERDAAGAAAVPGHLDRWGGRSRQVRRRPRRRGAVGADHERGHLAAAESSRSSRSQATARGRRRSTTTSPSAEPSASPGWQRPAEVSASCSATVTSAQRVAAAASAMAMTSSPKRRAGSATATAASPCTGERGGDDAHVAAGLAGAGGGAGGDGGEVGVVGQDDDLVGGGREDLVEDVVLGDAVGPAGARRGRPRRRRGRRARRWRPRRRRRACPATGRRRRTGASGVTEIRYGRPGLDARPRWRRRRRRRGRGRSTRGRSGCRRRPRRGCRRARRGARAGGRRRPRRCRRAGTGPRCPGRRAAGAAGPRRSAGAPWSRRASGGRAGSTPVTVVTSASRTRQSPAPPASTTPASRRTASWSGVASRATRAPSAAARTTSARSGRPSSTAATAASAPARATVRKVPSSGSATAV